VEDIIWNQHKIMLKVILSFIFVSSLVKSDTIFLREDRNHLPAVSDELLIDVRSKEKYWKESIPIRFRDATVADVRRQLGTILPGEAGYVDAPAKKTIFDKEKIIPDSFDARKFWPNCAAVIGHIHDQSNCGSCWAFGSTGAFNDRYCIATGDYKTLFSAADTLSCCTGIGCYLSMGCNGGQPAGAWHWFSTHGVATGGDYENLNDGTSCKPYPLQSCAHHVDPPEGVVACDKLEPYHTPRCTKMCSDSHYEVKYNTDMHYAGSSYSVRGEEHMQREIMELGSLSVALSVFEDFELYKSGDSKRGLEHYFVIHALCC